MGLFWNKPQYVKQWNQAKKLADRQQYVGADALFKEALAAAPDDPHLRHDYGFMLMNAGRHSEAEVTLEQAIALEPNVPLSYRSLAFAQVQLEKIDDARENMQRWWLLEPQLEASIHNMAAIMHLSGKIVESTFFARLEYERQPYNADSIRMYQATLASLTGVEGGQPDTPLPQLSPYGAELATVLFEVGHHQLAHDFCMRAVIDDPDNHEAKLVMSGILFRAGLYEGARGWASEVADACSENAHAHYNCGLASTALGDHGLARQSYERTVELDPDYAEAWRVLGDNYADSGDISKAADAFQRGYDLAPQDYRQTIGLARIRYLNGEPAVAKLLLQDAIQVAPNTAILHNNLGIMHAELGENNEARKCFELALDLEPGNSGFLTNLRALPKTL